jgi:hypothetical protein
MNKNVIYFLIYKIKLKIMNYIGIDISINSTAIFIETNGVEKILSFTNKKDNNIYIKELDRCGVDFTYFNREILKDYTDNEISKMRHYIDISDSIINKILSVIDLTKKTYCQIEGYSFTKNTSSILDIVSLSTLIRSKLLVNIKDIDLKIISPSSLKLETCKMVYEPINIGKIKPKYEYKNNLGISGGSFKKHDMYRAMVDGDVDTMIFGFLKDYIHILEMSKIPNPIEDIIDSIFACKVLKKNLYNGN